MSRALVKLTWVEVKLFTREPTTVAFSLAFPLLLLFVLAGVFGNDPDPDVYRGVGALDFYVPAYIALALAAVGFIGIPTHLAAYREAGVLRRLRASAVPILSLFGSQLAVALVLSGVSSLMIVSMVVVGYDVHAPASYGLVLLAYLLSAVSLAALGLFLGSLFKSPRTAQLVGMILFFVMMLLSGPGPPKEVLPTGMQRVAEALPLTHIVTLMQDPWLGLGWNYAEMGIVLLMTVGALSLAFRLFRWE